MGDTMKMSELDHWFLPVALLFALTVSGCSNEGPPRVIETDPEEILNPEAFLLGSATLSKNAFGIFVSDYIAYVVTSDESQGSLVLFDITDLEFPYYINEINSLFRSFNIGQRGVFGPAETPSAESGFIYVPVGANGLQIIDVTDAYNLSLFPTFTAGVTAIVDIDLSENVACIANTNSIITAGTSAAGILQTNIFTISTAADENYCYLIETLGTTSRVSHLRIIDPSIITAPVEVGSVELDGKEIIVSGSYAYVLIEDAGLTIVDISDPTTPSLVSQTEPFLTAKGNDDFAILSIFSIDETMKRAYVSMPNGVKIFDISDPLFPVDIGGFDLFDTPSAIDVNNGLLYITTIDFSGFNPPQLLVIDVSQF